MDLAPAGRPPSRSSQTATISTTRSPTSGASGRRCHCSTPTARARMSPRSAAGRSTCSTRSSSTPTTRCSATASPSASSIQHEQQHVETMLQTIQLCGLEHEGGGPRGRVGHARGRPRRGGDVRHGHGRRAVGLRQRAPGARGRARRLLDRVGAGDEQRVRRLPRRHGPRAADGVGARRPDVDVHPLRNARAS